jgi:CYTH domain-containing protein
MSTQRIGKYACLEIERRFLLRELPADLRGAPVYRRITDHYLDNTRLRLRRMTPPGTQPTVWKLGQKFRDRAQTALETTITNIVLTQPEYDRLAALGGRVIEKDRYRYPFEGRFFGIDVFQGDLAGLILAEVEFDSVEAARSMPVPSFAVAEVTDDESFTGGRLARTTREALALLLRDGLA